MTKRLVFIFYFPLCLSVISAQGLADAVIEDAAIDSADEPKKSPVKEVKQNETKETSKADSEKKSVVDFEYRLYSIGNMAYQPITSKTSPAVLNGLFTEKTAMVQINLELTARPKTSSNTNVVIKTDVEAKATTLYDKSSPFFDKGAGDWVRLNELFIEETSSDVVSLLIGKYRRIFSPGLFQNPLDRHNPVSSLPGEPAQREGAWIGELSMDGNLQTELLSRFRVSVAFLPNFFLDKNGFPVSTRTKFTFNPLSPLGITSSTETYSQDNMGGFARLYLDLFKGDFNAIYYYTEKQDQGGFSYSRYFFNRLEWHGEVLFYKKPHSDFIIPDSKVNFYTDALTGFRFDIDDYFSFNIEYLYRQENPRNYPTALMDQKRLFLSQLDTTSNGQTNTPMRNYLVLTLLGVNLKDRLDLAFNMITNPFDKEYLFSLRADYKVDKSAKISVAGLYKVGDTNSFYGNFLPFDYQVRLEFFIAIL